MIIYPLVPYRVSSTRIESLWSELDLELEEIAWKACNGGSVWNVIERAVDVLPNPTGQDNIARNWMVTFERRDS